MGYLKWLVLISLWAARLVHQPTTQVRVSGGWLRGIISPDGSHKQYLAIPYATINKENKFQATLPEAKWDGVLDAQNENIRCRQRTPSNDVTGQEDCLALHVYTPLETNDRLRPVMVFIHGGGFRDGSGSPFIYGPDYLVKHDVILVTFNYRLEIIGFLCLGIKEAPGNAGLKDQVAALKWVRNNIKAFGGDPDNVTIFGESAGSASVLYHLLSPMSKGLFKRAILQSGSAMSPWSLQFEPLKTASLLAEQMGYNTKDPREIFNIFKNKSSAELLTTRVPRTVGDLILSENIFVPCIEKKIDGVEQFLPDTPYNLLTKGMYNKVPLIMGYNNAEGYMFAGKENDTTLSNINFYSALPRDLIFLSEKEKVVTAGKLKELYMGGEEVSKKAIIKIAKLEGETGIIYPVIATIDILLETNSEPVYTYKFCYDGWLNYAKLIFGFWGTPGATHADELFYMFRFKIPFINAFLETEFIDKLTRLWTNFAKYGDPTPEVAPLSPKWRPSDKDNPRLLVIDKQFSTEPLWDEETIQFWNKTYTKYRRKA